MRLFYCVFIFMFFQFPQYINACGNHPNSESSLESVMKPISIVQVPEATSGFQWPLDSPFSNNGGWEFADYAGYPYPNNPSYYVYHPGEDWNRPNVSGGCGSGCSSDMCLPVRAAANGTVVYSNGNSWGGIVVQHNYQGQTWYTQYGHVRSITVGVGQNVSKGQQIAQIGNKETSCAHLHFEVRESDHPNPTYGAYWTTGSTGIGNYSNVQNWYEAPASFISSHPAYTTTSTCTAPTTSQNYTNNKTQTSARLNCTASASGTYRDFQYRKNGTTAWTGVSQTSSTYKNISGLQAGTTYQWQSAVRCSNGQYSNWSGYDYFTTSAASCNPPSYINGYANSCSQAYLYWGSVSGASYYRLYFWNGSSWQSFATPSSTNTYVNLAANTTYHFAVESICGSTASSFTTYKTITTPACKTSDEVKFGEMLPSAESSSTMPDLVEGEIVHSIIPSDENTTLPSQLENVLVYPNPSNGISTIEYEMETEGLADISLYDITGKEIMKLVNEKQAADLYKQSLDLSNLNPGVYLIYGKIGNKSIQEKIILDK